MDIQIKPIISEKANACSDKLNCYTFAVSPDANKFQIKDIVEKLYNVRVERVNTANYAGKRGPTVFTSPFELCQTIAKNS